MAAVAVEQPMGHFQSRFDRVVETVSEIKAANDKFVESWNTMHETTPGLQDITAMYAYTVESAFCLMGEIDATVAKIMACYKSLASLRDGIEDHKAVLALEAPDIGGSIEDSRVSQLDDLLKQLKNIATAISIQKTNLNETRKPLSGQVEMIAKLCINDDVLKDGITRIISSQGTATDFESVVAWEAAKAEDARALAAEAEGYDQASPRM